MTKIELDAAGIEAAAEAMWRHEVSGMPAASRARSTQLWEGQASALRERWIGRATAAITAYLSASKAVPEAPVERLRSLAICLETYGLDYMQCHHVMEKVKALLASPPKTYEGPKVKTYEDGLREAAKVAATFINERLYKPKFPACSYHAGELAETILDLIGAPK